MAREGRSPEYLDLDVLRRATEPVDVDDADVDVDELEGAARPGALARLHIGRRGAGLGLALLLIAGSSFAALARDEQLTTRACGDARDSWVASVEDLSASLDAVEAAKQRAWAIEGYAVSGRGAALIGALNRATAGLVVPGEPDLCRTREDARGIVIRAARLTGSARLVDSAAGALDTDARAIVASSDSVSYYAALGEARKTLVDSDARISAMEAAGVPAETIRALRVQFREAWAVVDAEDSDGDEPANNHSYGQMIAALNTARMRLAGAITAAEIREGVHPQQEEAGHANTEGAGAGQSGAVSGGAAGEDSQGGSRGVGTLPISTPTGDGDEDSDDLDYAYQPDGDEHRDWSIATAPPVHVEQTAPGTEQEGDGATGADHSNGGLAPNGEGDEDSGGTGSDEDAQD
ncbi:hypothetical protein [Actinomyces culturomici]|uniref:hypothetical protein n=1 Tax=Actinomyces culturomici TaxID=1926276 RepID=UPI000E207782|nr:hypothetical protein [Actinomyces culturomici]